MSLILLVLQVFQQLFCCQYLLPQMLQSHLLSLWFLITAFLKDLMKLKSVRDMSF